MAKASIIFFPYVGKKNQRNGKIPMYARIVLHSGKAETRLSGIKRDSWGKEMK